MKTMKPQFLLLLLLSLLFFSCGKEDDTSSGYNPLQNYAFDESIFGTYSTHFFQAPNPLIYACEEAELRTITANSATSISFNNLDLPLVSIEDDVYLFKKSSGSSGYQTTYSLRHYPCADSVALQITSTHDYTARYGKKVDGRDCPDGLPSDFEMMYCHQGPESVYCYSALNTKYKTQLGSLSGLSYLSTDSINQTIAIGMPESLTIVLPTDVSLHLLPGEYRLTETPAEGEQPILSVNIQEYYEWSVNTYDFEDGYLNVEQSGDTYTISFQFNCSENTLWTGYYEGNLE